MIIFLGRCTYRLRAFHLFVHVFKSPYGHPLCLSRCTGHTGARSPSLNLLKKMTSQKAKLRSARRVYDPVRENKFPKKQMTDILTLNSLYSILGRRGNTGTYGVRRLQKATVLSAVAGGLNTSVCGSWLCVCLQRYLVAVGGIALQQQRREQLD